MHIYSIKILEFLGAKVKSVTTNEDANYPKPRVGPTLLPFMKSHKKYQCS